MELSKSGIPQGLYLNEPNDQDGFFRIDQDETLCNTYCKLSNGTKRDDADTVNQTTTNNFASRQLPSTNSFIQQKHRKVSRL